MDSPIFGRILYPRDPDEESIDLLAYDPPKSEEDDDDSDKTTTSSTTVTSNLMILDNHLQKSKLQAQLFPSPSSSSLQPSPATQTLNRLSQDDVDLRYDHSQLELDVAAASAQSVERETSRDSIDERLKESVATINTTVTEPSLNQYDSTIDETQDNDRLSRTYEHAHTNVEEEKLKEVTKTFISSSVEHDGSAGQPVGGKLVIGIDHDRNQDAQKRRGASAIEKSLASQKNDVRSSGYPTSNEVRPETEHRVDGRTTTGKITCSSRRRPVEQLDTNGGVIQRFATLTEAEQATGIRRQRISAVLHGHENQAGGYGWRGVSCTGVVNQLKRGRTADTAAGVKTRNNRSSKLRKRTNSQVDHESQVAVVTFPSTCQASEKAGTQSCSMAEGLKETRPEFNSSLWKDCQKSAPKSAPTPAGTANAMLVDADKTAVLSGQAVKLLSDEIELHSVVINGDGPLGVVVSSTYAPASLLSALKVAPIHSDGIECAFAKSIDADHSLAHDCGLQLNDIFLAQASSGTHELMTHSQVVELAKNGKRPLTFVVARLRNANSIQSTTIRDNATSFTTSSVPTSNAAQAHSDGNVRQPDSLSKRPGQMCMPMQPQEGSGARLSGPASRADELSEANAHFTAATSAGSLFRCLDAPQSHIPRSDCIIPSFVPFCAKCKGSGTLAHHSWCPRHQHFYTSGAKDVLARIQFGAEKLGCLTCKNEYEQGRRIKELHSDSCCKYWRTHSLGAAANVKSSKRKQVPQQDGDDEEDEALARESQSRRAPRQRAMHQDSMRNANRRGSLLRPADLCNEDDFSSDYNDDDNDDDCSDLAAQVSMPCADRRNKALSHSVAKMTASSKGRSKAAFRVNMSQLQAGVRPVTPYTEDLSDPSRFNRRNKNDLDETDDEASDTSVVEVFCEELAEDPWGQKGYEQGDAIILSNGTVGIGNIETVLPSLRFELDPFATWKTYCTTHCTPKEGFQVIELRRDPLAKLDWGFTVERHEFGGACLVSSVDPVSPAYGARFLAASTERDDGAGLRLHDMLLSFNGRRIGGMMEKEFEVELEICGPLLTLVVSRYKLSACVEDRIRQAEYHYQCEVDQALNDQRRLGWTELISRSGPSLKNNVTGHSASYVVEEFERQEEPARLSADGSLQDQHKLKTSGPSELHFLAIPRASVIEACNKDSPQLTVGDRGLRGINSSCLPLASKLESSDANGHHLQLGGSSHVPASLNTASGTKQFDRVDCEAEQCEVGVDDAVQPFVMSSLDDDFENPWMGCACGSVHENDVPVFWIQCDYCESWYNVSPRCVGFDEKEAVSLPSWTCWGCPTSCRVTSHRNVGPTGASAVSATEVVHRDGSRTGSPTPQLSTLLTLDTSKTEPLPEGDCLISESQNVATRQHLGSAAERANSPSCHEKHDCTEEPTSQCHTTDMPVNSVADGIVFSGTRPPKTTPRIRDDGSFVRPRGPAPFGFQWDARCGSWVPVKQGLSSQAPLEAQREQECQKEVTPIATSCKGRNFSAGEMVFIQEHGSPEDGIARVLASYLDDSGNRIYDVKYIVGRKEKGVSAQFVTPYHF